MSKETAILRIWEQHWAKGAPDGREVLCNRFTKEAFSTIDAFIDERDNLILEAGCGTGRFCTLLTQHHPQAEVIGIDLSVNALEIARRVGSKFGSSKLSIIRADLFCLPFSDCHFDVVFSEGVISQFSMEGSPTYADALAEMVRITKPGGKVIISVVNWYCFPHTIYKWLLRQMGSPYEYGFEKSFKRNELVKLFKNLGLHEIEFSGYHPAHAFYRLARFSRLFRIAGALTDRAEKICQLLRMSWFSRVFGFEIVAMGRKRPSSSSFGRNGTNEQITHGSGEAIRNSQTSVL
jgi:ubiquinone/menaquinone biosynthesis C-methylase UbiE